MSFYVSQILFGKMQPMVRIGFNKSVDEYRSSVFVAHFQNLCAQLQISRRAGK